MPFLARYPESVPAGSVNDGMFLNVDIAPTLLDIAGVETPGTMQGESFKAGLTDPQTAVGRDAIYYRYWLHMAHHFVPAHYGIRTDTHKLAFFYGLPLDATGSMPAPTQPYFELYDLANDPLEMNNLYGNEDYAGIQAELKARLLELKAEIGDTDEDYPDLLTLQKQYFEQ
jgi:arylsulfatase A-like enzyme